MQSKPKYFKNLRIRGDIMEVSIIANKDLSISIQTSISPQDTREFGDKVYDVADEILKKVAKQLNQDIKIMKFDTLKIPERHVRTAHTNLKQVSQNKHLSFKK